MREYELFYLIGEANKSDFSTVNTEVQAIVTRFGGTLLPKVITEERRLAYEIDKQRNGLYVAQRFTLPDTDELDEIDEKDKIDNPIAEMNTQLILNKKVLRAIIVSATDLPELLSKDEKEAAVIAREQKEQIAKDGDSGKNIDNQLTDALDI